MKERNVNSSHYSKIIVFLLSGSIMIGHGARMIYQGVFFKGSAYVPNTFDLLFDWLSLLILGCIILYYAFVSIYKSDAKKV